MRSRVGLFAALAGVALSLLACSSGGSSSNSGPAVGGNEPCAPSDGTDPRFDVWDVNFQPGGRNTMRVTVDTTTADRAAEFRLTVACQGTVLADGVTIGGMPCSFPPPSSTPGVTPECPEVTFGPLPNNLGALSRVQCLFEIVPTEALGIGTGLCADPGRSQYRLTVTVGSDQLPLSQEADNCQAPESCLSTFFGVNLTPLPTATGTPVPTATAVP